MKKYLMMILAVCLVASLALAGCGAEAEKIESEVESAVQEMESKVEEGLDAAESEAAELEGEASTAVDSAIETLKADTESILSKLEVKEKAAMEVLKEDEQTVKLEFTVLEADAETEAEAVEAKVAKLESEFIARVNDLKNQGVAEAKLIVSFLDQEGTEIYNKIFG